MKVAGDPLKRSLSRSKSSITECPAPAGLNDHFAERDGVRFAGLHLIIDLWGASGLEDVRVVEKALRGAVAAGRATLLHLHLHRLGQTGGISGVALLAESHISLHTWPEHGYAAVDLFMCGDSAPHNAASVLCEAFSPATIIVSEHRRGTLGSGPEGKP